MYYALNGLDLDDIIYRPGSKRFKYVEPVEAAYEVVEETMEPFALQLQRLKDLEMLPEFQQFATGIWNDIQTFLEESDSEILDYINEDAPEWYHELLQNYAETVNSTQEKQVIEHLLSLVYENEG